MAAATVVMSRSGRLWVARCLVCTDVVRRSTSKQEVEAWARYHRALHKETEERHNG